MTWACLTCGQDIVVNPDAKLGEWRYMHLEPATQSNHPAVRPPTAQKLPWEKALV